MVVYDDNYRRDQEANRLRQLFQGLLESRRKLDARDEQLETFRRERRPRAPLYSVDLTGLADYTLKLEEFRREEQERSEALKAAEDEFYRIEQDALEVLPEDAALVFDYGTHGGVADLLGRYSIRKVVLRRGAPQVEIARTGETPVG